MRHDFYPTPLSLARDEAADPTFRNVNQCASFGHWSETTKMR